MVRWLRLVNRSAVTLAAVLCLASATPLTAQQASAPAPRVAAAQQDSATAPLAGPRLRAEWRSVEPSFADSASGSAAAVQGTHTITITTLALVLLIILLVVLID